MLNRAKDIIAEVAKETDSVILFHSLSGKDSIVLLDLMYPKFKRILCVYMYLVKDLEHINQYYMWAKSKYPNIEFVQVPHYAYYNYRKYGFMGMESDSKQREWSLSQIADKVRERTGIEWVCCGFKQSDSLNRRLMLRSYVGDKGSKEAISWKSKKFYPLSTYKNADVLEYISANNLKQPESYGGIGQSCGASITSAEYLNYLKNNYPQDLRKIYSIFPATRTILPKYEAKRDKENNA